ncbi:ferric-chelate reductase 1 [Cherax quadricarinatus]|uniref:ferric-chelate reductase 1 n=1 Tax=Cherax quadricarinatus TaxID=27406 RepID=UPI00237838AA|nr:ferric-chelate reductase 1-like [Cherax quadricarinatus]
MLLAAHSVLLVVVLGAWVVEAFPGGAPIEACILENPNRPNHPGTSPQPPSTLKHIFTASDAYYSPGSTIQVYIEGPPFKGFFIQGRDAHTNEWIGEFDKSDDTESHPECSAVTHGNPRPKSRVILTWRAPLDRSGTVTFTGTILNSYSVYWSDLIANVVPRSTVPRLG